MAKSPTEQIRELEKTIVAMQASLEHTRRDVDDATSGIKEGEISANEIRQELALLRQRLEDHLKRMDVWGSRLWAFVLALIGAVLSLAAGLIVTLAKK